MREPTYKEVLEVVTAAKGSSAPGPSVVPYKVYKEENSTNPERIRSISLSVEGKIFNVLSRRMTVSPQEQLHRHKSTDRRNGAVPGTRLEGSLLVH